MKKIMFVFCMLFLIASCSEKPVEKNYYGDYIELVNENSHWECVEWRNTTKLNPDYFDNCCFDIDVIEPDTNFLQTDDVTVSITIGNQSDESIERFSGKLCMELGDAWERDASFEGQTIDVDKCRATPKYVTTGQLCITKKRRSGLVYKTIDIG